MIITLDYGSRYIWFKPHSGHLSKIKNFLFIFISLHSSQNVLDTQFTNIPCFHFAVKIFWMMQCLSPETVTQKVWNKRCWKNEIVTFAIHATHAIANYLMLQFLETGPYLLRLPNGNFFVRCKFTDCQRYFHIECIHPTFPDEALKFSHLDDLKDNGIHCSFYDPGHEKK